MKVIPNGKQKSVNRLHRLHRQAQQPTAYLYYFASLALGLLGGLAPETVWLSPALMAVLVGVLWCGDHPTLSSKDRNQEVLIDRAITAETELWAELTRLLGSRPTQVDVLRTDLVNDTTCVRVRYVPGAPVAETTVEPQVRLVGFGGAR